jgi:hypothetical protein
LIDAAVQQVFASGAVRPMEFGGVDGTVAITSAVISELSKVA